MSDLVSVLPVIGALIVIGTLVLGARPAPTPVPVKPPRRR